MKSDLKDKYCHLFNKTQPFNKCLFGGDVIKTVKYIRESSKISNCLAVGNGYNKLRGGFRGRLKSLWNTRRSSGRGGRGRGSTSMSVDQSEPKSEIFSIFVLTKWYSYGNKAFY